MNKKYTWWQRFKVFVLGACYLEHRTKACWTGHLPFYLCCCHKHGYYEDYPHGHSGYFTCPKCREERSSFNNEVQEETSNSGGFSAYG